MSQQINLFNPVFLKQRKYFSLLAMLQMLGLFLLGSALFYGYAIYQVKLLTQQSEESSKRYETEQARLARYTEEFSPEKAAKLLQDKVNALEARRAAQDEIVETLKTGAIGNSTGYSEYMRAFARQVVSGLWLTGFDIAGDGTQLGMSGSALSPELVPVYIQRLNREPVMRGKSVPTLQIQRSGAGTHVVGFTLRTEAGGATKP